MRRALALIGLAAALCGCGTRTSVEQAASGEHRIELEGLSLSVPAGWSSWMQDAGPWLPAPEIWVANVPLPDRASGIPPPPYDVLPHLPRHGIVVFVFAEEEDPCLPGPPMHFRLAGVLDDYEGKPAPNVSHGELSSQIQGRCLDAQAWFGV